MLGRVSEKSEKGDIIGSFLFQVGKEKKATEIHP